MTALLSLIDARAVAAVAAAIVFFSCFGVLAAGIIHGFRLDERVAEPLLRPAAAEQLAPAPTWTVRDEDLPAFDWKLAAAEVTS